MEYSPIKLLPILFVYLLSYSHQIDCEYIHHKGETIPNVPIESVTKDENYLKVESIFDQTSLIKTCDLIECEVVDSKPFETNDIHVYTQIGKDTSGYVFYPVPKDKKCFSFQLRTKVFPHILFSVTPWVVTSEKLEVIFDYDGNSLIRTKDGKHVSTIPSNGIVNDYELRGFWIRWLDDHLLEVGRDTDYYPILFYRVPEKISPNFIGILSYTTTGEWILHKEPKCGPYNSTTTTKIQAETKCKIVTKLNSGKINILQKSQEHILNQIKNLHGIIKESEFRSKEILLEYQELIRKHFKNAEENQNQIYASDNETYSPLKAVTFNEITKEYFQFLEELQLELAAFKQIPEITNGENVFGHCSNCCRCNIVQN